MALVFNSPSGVAGVPGNPGPDAESYRWVGSEGRGGLAVQVGAKRALGAAQTTADGWFTHAGLSCDVRRTLAFEVIGLDRLLLDHRQRRQLLGHDAPVASVVENVDGISDVRRMVVGELLATTRLAIAPDRLASEIPGDGIEKCGDAASSLEGIE